MMQPPPMPDPAGVDPEVYEEQFIHWMIECGKYTDDYTLRWRRCPLCGEIEILDGTNADRPVFCEAGCWHYVIDLQTADAR